MARANEGARLGSGRRRLRRRGCAGVDADTGVHEREKLMQALFAMPGLVFQAEFQAFLFLAGIGIAIMAAIAHPDSKGTLNSMAIIFIGGALFCWFISVTWPQG